MRFSKVAGGNLLPASIVILSTTTPGQVTQAAGNTVPLFGITQIGQRMTPWAPVQDGNAAIQYENVRIIGEREECLLQIGGTVTIGDYLTSDGNGRGLTTTTSGQFIIAQALESGVNLDYIIVRVFESYPY